MALKDVEPDRKIVTERALVADFDRLEIAPTELLPSELVRDWPQLSDARTDHPRTDLQPATSGAKAIRRKITRARDSLVAMLEEEAARGTLFLFVPICLGIGVLTYHGLATEPQFRHILAGVALMSVFGLVARSGSASRRVLVGLCLMTAGLALAKLETWRLDTAMLGAEVTSRITGTIEHVEASGRGRARIVLAVERTERPTLRYGPDRVRVTAPINWQDFAPGERIVGTMRLFPLSGPVRPGGYDFAREGYFDGIGATGFIFGKPRRVSDTVPAPWSVTGRIERARHDLATHIASSLQAHDDAASAVVIALVTGMRGGVDDATNEALRRSGLAHMLAISGLHMALVAVAVMGGLRFAFALFPAWADTRPAKPIAAVAALGAVAVYLLISGASVATIRSFAMLAVMLAAILARRDAVTQRNLAVAAIVILAAFPHELVGPGFQMSFAATAALIAGYGLWVKRKRKQSVALTDHGPGFRLVRGLALVLAGIAASSIIAGLATLPFAAYHFERLAPWSIAANLAAMPVVSFIVMPAGLGAMLAIPFGLDQPLWSLMAHSVALVLKVAHAVAAWPGPDAFGQSPALALALVAIALCLFSAMQTRLRALAIIPLTAAVLLVVANPKRVIAIISEDAELVAVKWTEDPVLAVNTAKPQAFLVQNHSRTLGAIETRTPDFKESANSIEPSRFACTLATGICRIKLPDGRELVTIPSLEHLDAACRNAAIVIVQSPTKRKPACRDGTERSPQILTQTDLALKGAATISLAHSWLDPPKHDPTEADQMEPDHKSRNALAKAKHADPADYLVSFAIGTPERPWHADRIHSRAARGLLPYVPARQTRRDSN